MDDLNTFDTKENANKGMTLLVLKPDLSGFFLDAEGNPWSLTLMGQDSAEYRAARQAMKRVIWERATNGTPVGDKELDDVVADVFAACVVSWTGIALNGELLPCTKENAAMLFRKFPWLLDRVSEFVETRANFTLPPSAPSVDGSENSSGSEEPDQAPRKARRKA